MRGQAREAALLAGCAAAAEPAAERPLRLERGGDAPASRAGGDRERLLAGQEAASLANPARDCSLPQSLGLCPEGQLTLIDGIECGSGHFTCNCCLQLAGYAEQLACASPFELNRCKGQLKCIACPADAPPFGAAAVARRIPQSAFEILHAATVRATETSRDAQMQADYDRRLREAERRMGEVQAASVAELRTHAS